MYVVSLNASGPYFEVGLQLTSIVMSFDDDEDWEREITTLRSIKLT